MIASPRVRACTAGLLALMASACGGAGSDDGPSGLPGPAEVRIVAPARELFVGQSVQLRASARDAAGDELPAGDPTWQTSNANVAQINESGLLTAMAPGSASLQATISGKSASVSVTVEDLPGYDVTVQVTSTFAPATISVRRTGTVRFAFSGIQQDITFSTAFPGAPTNVPATSSGTVARQFNTVGDFRFESSTSPGLAGLVRVR